MRRSFFAILCLATLASIAHSADEAQTMKVWPGVPPGDQSFRTPATPKARPGGRANVERIALVTEPTLTIFRAPASRANGAAVVVCPGGGYNILAWDLEGTEIAEWLNSIGVTAAVLKYRVPRRDGTLPHAAPLQDAQRALRHVRHQANTWGIDPSRIGILGFSAGGNLAVMAGVDWDRTTYPRIDAIDDLSCRPDFLIPVYPAYLGDEDKAGPLSPLIRVTEKTPPTFLVVTHDDKLRGVNAALFYIELKKAKVPAELHIFTRGGHGYGLRESADAVSQWPKLCEAWLRAQGLLKTTDAAGSN
jgi:acetyl esterase/lipase